MRFLFESSLLLHPAPSLALWPSLKSLCNYKLPFFVYLYDLMTAGIRLVAFCVFLACVCAPAPGQAQTPDAGKIIDAYLKAAGGARALSRVQTLSIEGTVAGVGDANSGTYTFDTKLPNRYYTELILGGKSVIESYNGKSAWREDSSGSPVTMFGQESVDMQAEAQFANLRLLNLKKNKVAAAFI